MPTLDSLVCPKCHGGLTAHAGRELRCSRDGVRYPVVDGIPSFIIPGPDPVALPGCALSLVLPALNEGENLDRVLPELKKALVALGPTYEIIVVDGPRSLEWLPPLSRCDPVGTRVEGDRLRCPRGNSDSGAGRGLSGARGPLPLPGSRLRPQSRPAGEVCHLLPAHLYGHVAAAQ